MLSFNICHHAQPEIHLFSCPTVKILGEHCELHCSAALHCQHAATSQFGNSLSSSLSEKVIKGIKNCVSSLSALFIFLSAPPPAGSGHRPGAGERSSNKHYAFSTKAEARVTPE